MSDEQQRILNNMTPAQKPAAAHQLDEAARELKAAGIRQAHPDWSEEQVKRAVGEAFLYARD